MKDSYCVFFSFLLSFFQEKEMAAAALTINSQREEVVDFTVPFYNEYASVVIKVRMDL